MPDFNDPLPAPRDADGRAFGTNPDACVIWQNNGPIASNVGSNDDAGNMETARVNAYDI